AGSERRLRSPHERPRPHGAEPHGVPAHRWCAHVPVQLAVRPWAGRRVPPADREHRYEPRGRRRDGADPELAQRLLADGRAYEDEGAVRFRMPDEGVTAWADAVLGRIEVPNEKLEDVV